MSASVMDQNLISGFTAKSDGAAIRTQAESLLAGQSLPGIRHEEYKYTPLNRLNDTEWKAGQPTNLNLSDWSDRFLPEVPQVRIVFVNGHFAPELSDCEGLNVAFLQDGSPNELGQLAVANEAKFKVAAHLGQLSKPAMPLTAAINTLSFADGAVITLKSKLDKPIHLVNITSGQHATAAPRTVIIAEDGAEATLIETYLSDGETLCLPVTEVFVRTGATLEHVRLGNEDLLARHIGLVEVRQESDSTYRSYNVVFGAALTRNDINLFVAGERAHTRFDGIVALDGEQHADNHTRLDHAVAHCESFEIYKHLLGGQSRAVFNGKIFVHQDAQKTDAKQTNMTLLLSPQAQIDTKPQLEIFADDVKCTHGATIGQLRSDALFYMQSRGIDEVTARGLLVYAFAAEVLELIENGPLKAALEQMLLAKLGTS